MTTYRIAELTGALLDAAVADVEGIAVVLRSTRFSPDGDVVQQPSVESEFDPDGPANEFSMQQWKMWRHYRPSVDWAIGGPIIERELITIHQDSATEDECRAYVAAEFDGEAKAIYASVSRADGPSPLIAAMRAYVTSKVGETIDL